MPVQLRVDVRDTASAGLRQLMLRTGSVNEVLEEIGSSLVTSTQRRFEDEQDPTGSDWKEHAPSTAERRGSDASILRDEVDLFDSLDPAQVKGSKVYVGTNRIYGRIQQLGGEAGPVARRVTIPARPYLGISADDEREIGLIVADHVRGL